MDNHRKPFVEKFIKDLKTEDLKVALSGVIVDKTTNSFLIDDGTGQIRILSEEVPHHEYVRAYGNLINLDDERVLQAEIVQDLSKIDKLLHKKIKELMK